jgi:dihydroorotase-like cyclic amidohydrolase
MAMETIDCNGNYIIPGVIEPHTHLGIEQSFQKDIISETRAAAGAGITTIFHFILEPDSICERLPFYFKAVEQFTTVDVGFHCACMREVHLQEMPELIKKGIRGFKFFLAYKGGEFEKEGIFGIDLGYLYRGMERAKEFGGIVQVHAENYELVKLFSKRYGQTNDFLAFQKSRPVIAVDVDAYTACRMAEQIGCPLYLVHINAVNIFDMVRGFRAKEQKIYIEVLTRTLTIDEEGSGIKKPELALRNLASLSRASIDKIWEAVRTGEVDCLATDSIPCTL